mgnify:FL=1
MTHQNITVRVRISSLIAEHLPPKGLLLLELGGLKVESLHQKFLPPLLLHSGTPLLFEEPSHLYLRTLHNVVGSRVLLKTASRIKHILPKLLFLALKEAKFWLFWPALFLDQPVHTFLLQCLNNHLLFDELATDCYVSV